MRILIADKFSAEALSELKSLKHDVSYNPELADDALVRAIGEHASHVLVVRSTKVNAAALRSSETLQLVVRAGAGVNTIDIATASQLGIFVANCPGKNAIAVAELVFGLILSLDRRIPDNVASLRQGIWNKKEFSKGAGLKGRTLGLLGFGAIAKEVAIRAQAFEMDVIAWSRSLTAEIADNFQITSSSSPNEVAKAADIVSVHLAAAKETIKICSSSFFSAMKDGAMFINTSRGDVVDEDALAKALVDKRLLVGLDVFQNEPMSSSGSCAFELANNPNVYTTHHIGASTAQAEEAIGFEALRVIKTFAATGEVLNCVNIDRKSPATHVMTVRHLNRVGVLASILGPVRQADINVLEMENLVFEGNDAAMAKIRLSREPESSVIAAIKSSSSAILSVSVIPIN